MFPPLALFVWLILLISLLCFDPARNSKTKAALWIPVAWMFIVGSRLPSQWYGGQITTTGTALEEGNILDRGVFSILILLAAGVLISRSFRWGDFMKRNPALTALLSFALLSVLWSDFAFVALKRWFRDLGNYLVVLVILSDPRPLEAACTVLRRLSYLLIPLSVVLIKYFPEISKQYEVWTGLATYSGATTSKNMLGLACLISGLFFFWDTVTRWKDRQRPRTRRIILENIAFLAMTLWLLKLASSATSGVCLVLGSLVIAAAHTKPVRRRPAFLKVVIPATFCLYLILAFGANINADLAPAVNRNATLTDRTTVWQLLLSMRTNPIVGTGYESFWLGPRLDKVWQSFPGLNEAHNGYLDVYLNLGLVGVFLLGGFLIASYRTICHKFSLSISIFALAVWTALVFYNVTEAAFVHGLVWITLLISSVPLMTRNKVPVPRAAALLDSATVAKLSLSTTDRQRS